MARQSMQIGDVFTTKKNGNLEVVHYFDSKHVQVRFIDTGFTTMAQADNIRKGNVKDPLVASVYGVGCLGVGPLKTYYMEDNKKFAHPLYILWSSMLQRCYDSKFQERNPTYKGCSVCKEWLNYQDFCISIKQVQGYEQWADYQVGVIDTCYELDKDKLVDGNKVYSPSTCCFITKSENVQLSHRK